MGDYLPTASGRVFIFTGSTGVCVIVQTHRVERRISASGTCDDVVGIGDTGRVLSTAKG